MDDFEPTAMDRVVLWIIIAVGTYTIYRFVQDRLYRAAYIIEYKYLTKDHKVIEPAVFTSTSNEERKVADSGSPNSNV